MGFFNKALKIAFNITKEKDNQSMFEIDNTSIKHIDKNGLSFDCPDYYDIGNCQSSDEAHKSMAALVKKDRSCELYIAQYWNYAFDNIAKRNNQLLMEYLKKHGYTNIKENKQLPYCFDANVNTQLGEIRATILYNFNYSNVIMIVCNYYPNSNYDGIADMEIINNTIKYGNQDNESNDKSEYVHCNICNHLIDVDFGICEYCGFDINDECEDEKQPEDVEHICSADECEKQSESVQCPICNKLIDVDFGICEYCGFDINKKDESEEQIGYVKCPICNNLINVKYGICDFCGFEIDDN